MFRAPFSWENNGMKLSDCGQIGPQNAAQVEGPQPPHPAGPEFFLWGLKEVAASECGGQLHYIH